MPERVVSKKKTRATPEKQAYKLYIIDGWQRFQSMEIEDLGERKIWIKECFGNKIAGFKLSRANIDRLVEAAERNGLLFSYKKNKSQLKVGPGRRLYDGLIKLELNTNLHNLESLAKILELSQSRNFQKTQDFGKFIKMVQKKDMKKMEEYINLKFVIPYNKRNSVNFLKKVIEFLQGVVNVEYTETETDRRYFEVQISIHANRERLFDIIDTLINKTEILHENFK